MTDTFFVCAAHGLFLLNKHLCQEGYIGDQKQYDQQTRKRFDDFFAKLLNRSLGDRRCNKQIDAIGRTAEADCQVHGQHDTKGDRVHSNTHTNGQQDGGKNDRSRDVIDKHTN